jgi:hypothetical protein
MEVIVKDHIFCEKIIFQALKQYSTGGDCQDDFLKNSLSKGFLGDFFVGFLKKAIKNELKQKKWHFGMDLVICRLVDRGIGIIISHDSW